MVEKPPRERTGRWPRCCWGTRCFRMRCFWPLNLPPRRFCAAVAESTRKVCAGEIVQTLRRHTTNITVADYRRIIDLKTAELFRVSCLLGSKLAGFPEAYVLAVGQFGRHLGIAYQIYDDLADFYGEEKRIGKTLGTDLASGKMTLPLLLLMEKIRRGPIAKNWCWKSKVITLPPIYFCVAKQMNTHGIFAAVDAEVPRGVNQRRGRAGALARHEAHHAASRTLRRRSSTAQRSRRLLMEVCRGRRYGTVAAPAPRLAPAFDARLAPYSLNPSTCRDGGRAITRRGGSTGNPAEMARRFQAPLVCGSRKRSTARNVAQAASEHEKTCQKA